MRPADPWVQLTASNNSSLEDCGFKPWVLTTTQRRLRERDAVSAEVNPLALKLDIYSLAHHLCKI
jgi:hypothetical protein